MSSIRTLIRSKIADLITGMLKIDGYSSDWTTCNQPDTALGDYPRALVFIGNETCNDTEGGAFAGAYDCEADIEIVFDVQLSTEADVPFFAIDSLADDALDDLKRLFGRHISLDGIGTLPILYRGATGEPYTDGDYFVTKRMMTRWAVRYMQSRTEPTTIAY